MPTERLAKEFYSIIKLYRIYGMVNGSSLCVRVCVCLGGIVGESKSGLINHKLTS